ncbi:MAG TPA: hypothetical protein HPQ04_00675 [Rhodospirillaceae bacterium]|nr:hypothetical protein [Rhodospirillaceae bacterium]
MEWRRRLQELARGAGKPHPPLFLPLLFGCAAQIDAIAPAEMALDGTRLRKNLTELRRMLNLDGLYCAVPSGMEVEAATGDLAVLEAHPRIAAGLDAIRQIAATDRGDTVIAVGLTGPATLAAQLRAGGMTGTGEAVYETAGQILAGLTRLYAESGVHLLSVHERERPTEEEDDHWRGALGTLGNVARFHRIPPLLVMEGVQPVRAWPAQTIGCPAAGQPPLPPIRPQGRTWSRDPAAWPGPSGGAVILSEAEVPAERPVAALLTDVERVRHG